MLPIKYPRFPVLGSVLSSVFCVPCSIPPPSSSWSFVSS